MNAYMSQYKMLEHERINISEAIDINKTNKSKECMLCHYWYFLDKNFNYGPYLCNGCYNIMQESIDSKNIGICFDKKVHTEFIFYV